MDGSPVTVAPHANIGPRGCKRRGRMGWLWLALGITLVARLATTRGAPTMWFAAAAIPFFFASLGFFQAREQTCVFLAAVGQRDLDSGSERITETAELSRTRALATRVWIRAVIATVVLTAVAFGVAALAD